MKKQSGITLIALVITIILLLILASITISLTIGERGIFNTAKRAVENYKNAEEREFAELNNFEQETYNVINNIGNIITKQPVKKIEITPKSVTLKPNETIQLTATVLPNNAVNKSVTWSSSNPNIVTIEQDGRVTGVSEGTTTIIATVEDGSEIKGNCTITVEKQKLYLYNSGETYNNITGGWITKWEDASNGAGTDIWNKGTMNLDTTNPDKMIFTATSTNGYIGAVLTTVNKIDLTNYSILNIQYGNLYIEGTIANHYMLGGVSKEGYDYVYHLFGKNSYNKFTNVNYSNLVLPIDISSIQEGYIAPIVLIDTNDRGERASYSAEIYKIWLE